MSYAIPSVTRVPAAERGLTIADFLVPVRVGERVSPRMRDLGLVLAGTALLVLGSRISIPLPGTPVPVTLQTLAVLLVGGALGLRRGAVATALFVALGIALAMLAAAQPARMAGRVPIVMAVRGE